MEINNEILADAIKSALRVEFLSSGEELKLYAGALYAAVMWGMGIDGKNMGLFGQEIVYLQKRAQRIAPRVLFNISAS